MDLKNLDMLSLQSQYLQQDRTTQAMCAALEPLWRDLAARTGLVLIYPVVDRLTGKVLDELAWTFHVDAYDASAPDIEKQRMIKSSFLVHKYKGTAYAVKEIVSSVFGTQAEVLEWFEYGGHPYHFKVYVYCLDRGATEDSLRRAMQLLNAGKNLRSVLDDIQLVLMSIAGVSIVSAAIRGDRISVM